MTTPSFDKFSVLDRNRELSQIETAIGHTIFDRRWHQGEYAELRVLENASGLALFTPAMMLDPEERQEVLAGKNLTYAPVGSPVSATAWSVSLPKAPKGPAAP